MDDVRKLSGEHTYGTWRRQKGFLPLNIVGADGSSFTDSTGKRYLDLSSQLMCSNLGHGNRAVIDAIKQQAEELAFIAPGYTTKARSVGMGLSIAWAAVEPLGGEVRLTKRNGGTLVSITVPEGGDP